MSDYQQAKEEISALLNIRTKLRRIWKTDLEENGRHYVYFTQYISFLIDMSLKTKDVGLLIILCKRLLVEENLISKIQVRNESRKALLNVLGSFQQPPLHESVFKTFLSNIQAVDPEIEKVMISDFEPVPENEVYRLVIACDLKRARKQCEISLEHFIVYLYTSMYLKASGSMNTSPAKQSSFNAEKEKKMSGKLLQRALQVTKSIQVKSEAAAPTENS